MRYVFRTFTGFALIVAANFALGYSIYQLLQIGTCASGGPYVSARQCPDGTAGLGVTIPAAIILLLIGAAVYSGRGKAPGSDNPPHNALIPVWIWTGIFWSLAVGCFLGIWGPDANPGPGGKTGALIVGILFVPMGALGLLFLGAGPKKGKGGKEMSGTVLSDGATFGNSIPGAKRVRAAAGRIPGLDPVARLERLQSLRERNAITDAEFEQMKQQILGGR